MDTLKEAKKCQDIVSVWFTSSLPLVSTRALKRGHPDPRFIQTVPRVSVRAWDEGRDAPEQFSYKLSEIDAFLRNKVKR